MKTTVIGYNAFQSLRVELDPGETFLSEAGKMVRASANIDIDVTMKRKSGGIFGALKRMVGGDSLFFATYRAGGGQPGEIVLSPTLTGNVGLIQLDGRGGWYCTGGSYMASGPDVHTDAKWQGLKGALSGENMVFLHATGTGPLVIDAFGALHEEMVDGAFTVDNGHVVAFEDTLQYEITKAGGSWMTSFLAGEGIVLRFQGRGRVLIQSHNLSAFGGFIGPKLPPRG